MEEESRLLFISCSDTFLGANLGHSFGRILSDVVPVQAVAVRQIFSAMGSVREMAYVECLRLN